MSEKVKKDKKYKGDPERKSYMRSIAQSKPHAP